MHGANCENDCLEAIDTQQFPCTAGNVFVNFVKKWPLSLISLYVCIKN